MYTRSRIVAGGVSGRSGKEVGGGRFSRRHLGKVLRDQLCVFRPAVWQAVQAFHHPSKTLLAIVVDCQIPYVCCHNSILKLNYSVSNSGHVPLQKELWKVIKQRIQKFLSFVIFHPKKPRALTFLKKRMTSMR